MAVRMLENTINVKEFILDFKDDKLIPQILNYMADSKNINLKIKLIINKDTKNINIFILIYLFLFI
ncbi:MAG TPA: hypothetical protein EYH00_03945 [Archaeoglobus profundus]|nr:hypothetical protein [Archaeoglobus profundus]